MPTCARLSASSRHRLALFAACLVAAAPARAQEGATAATDTTSVVAARDIPRGVALESADISAPAGEAGPVGWIARRVIHAGEALRQPAVAPPPLIRRGSTVEYLVERAGIQLALRGTALTAGALGDTLFVRLDARRRVRGVVTGPGTVADAATATRPPLRP